MERRASTIDIFERRAIIFQQENPQESKNLAGQLLEWGAAVSESSNRSYTTLGDFVSLQIDYNLHLSGGNELAHVTILKFFFFGVILESFSNLICRNFFFV